MLKVKQEVHYVRPGKNPPKHVGIHEICFSQAPAFEIHPGVKRGKIASRFDSD